MTDIIKNSWKNNVGLGDFVRNSPQISRKRKRGGLKITTLILIILIVALIGARLYLPIWLKDHVNHVLANIKGYEGSVEDIDVALYRGAYKINGIKIFKKTVDAPVPFFSSDVMDLSIEWKSLLQGRIVSTIDFSNPEINFAVDKTGDKQTGENVDWTKPVMELAPFDINKITLNGGKIAYKNYSTKPNVDIFINKLQAQVLNLKNVEDKTDPLPSPITITGQSIGNGKININGRMNIIKKDVDMDLDMKLENAQLTSINDYAKAFAFIDFKKGDLSIYSEVAVKDNKISGYVKPIAHDIQIVDLRKSENPIKAAWEILVGTVVTIFTNHSKDQFATKVELSGDLSKIETSTWDTVIGIFKNAFIEALSKSTDNEINFPGKKD